MTVETSIIHNGDSPKRKRRIMLSIRNMGARFSVSTLSHRDLSRIKREMNVSEVVLDSEQKTD